MRLIVNGQQAFGKAALEKILEAGQDEVVAVYTAPDKEGRPVDPVKEAALEHGLPLYQPASYKDQAVLDEMAALNADLMVMAYVIIFIPEAARDTPKMGSICFHPSLLPLHRGPSSINWPIIGGRPKPVTAGSIQPTVWTKVTSCFSGKSKSALTTPWSMFTSRRFSQWRSTRCLKWSTPSAPATRPMRSRMKARRHMKAGARRPMLKSTGPNPQNRSTT